MNIVEQTSPELVHVAGLIKGISIAMLTTIGSDGELSSRPMGGLEMDLHGAIWFFTNVHSSKVEELHAMGLAFTDPDKSTYVSLSGHGEISTDRNEIRRLWTPFVKPWFPEGPESSDLALLKFVPDAADYWDGPNNKMIRAFGMLASIAAAKPIAMGEHGSHKDLSAQSPEQAS